MENPVIHDSSLEASWFVNTGSFPFMDYETKVRFEPRVPVRTVLTPWMESQPTIEAYELPARIEAGEDEALAEAKALADAAAAKALADAEAQALADTKPVVKAKA